MSITYEKVKVRIIDARRSEDPYQRAAWLELELAGIHPGFVCEGLREVYKGEPKNAVHLDNAVGRGSSIAYIGSTCEIVED